MSVKCVRFKHWGTATHETDFQTVTATRQVVLEVQTTSIYDGHETVFNGAINFVPTEPDHVICPYPGQVYYWADDLNERMALKKLSLQLRQPEDCFQLWDLTLDYELIKEDGFEPAVHPLARPMEIERDHLEIDCVVEKDVVTDDPIQNAAEDAFDPMPTEQKTVPIWRIKKNVASWSDAYEATFSNTRNQSTWRHIPANKGILKYVRATPKAELYYGTLVFYFALEAEIENWNFIPWGTKLHLLNAGYRYYDTNWDQKRRASGPDGDAPDQPVLLNSGGHLLPEGDPPEWLDFDTKLATNWSALGI